MSASSKTEIDLGYRPHSYFWAESIGVKLSSSIKGARRKRLYERSVRECDPLPPGLQQPRLSESDRQEWGKMHPSFMGGEYLPDPMGREVEIARIVIASTTQDVTSLYVRTARNRFNYRVVDEYEGETLCHQRYRDSDVPLTLQELIAFFFSAWNLLEVLEMNFEQDGYPVDEVHDFVVEASSNFYPQFGALVHARVGSWLVEVRAGLDDEGEETS